MVLVAEKGNVENLDLPDGQGLSTLTIRGEIVEILNYRVMHYWDILLKIVFFFFRWPQMWYLVRSLLVLFSFFTCIDTSYVYFSLMHQRIAVKMGMVEYFFYILFWDLCFVLN